MLCPCEKEIVTKREMLHSSDIVPCKKIFNNTNDDNSLKQHF